MALAMYGIVYLLVQMCIFWVFVVGNYEYIHKEAHRRRAFALVFAHISQ